ncbi:elongator complex protein 5 [Neodiprion pinetum]|uniref:elongator complex protein 5 n=1 Tax=Neodiprion pinetum TaxID=441929 RepID=UPI001EE04455|nr:elongator complex protein 5 [Neodiprion pinetum]
MSLLTTLPTLDGARIIVVDEDSEAKYAESLITAWVPIWKEKDGREINVLRFSGPKSSSRIYANSLRGDKIEVHDYYTFGLNEIDPYSDKKLWEIVRVDSFKQTSTVVLDSLSSLLLYKSLAETCRFLSKLSTRVTLVVCIYQRDFVWHKIPSIKTLGTSYVRLESVASLKLGGNLSYKALTSHCKSGGSILQQAEIVEQNISSYEIQTEMVGHKSDQKTSVVQSKPSDKIQASFRIEMNDREMEQRNATPLPYTLSAPSSNESKIHYEPDEIDDLDEEDPDDDLDF